MGIRLNLIEKVIIIFYFLNPLLYLVRVLAGDSLISFVLLRALQPLVIATLLASLLVIKIRSSAFSLFGSFCLFYGVVAGLLNGNDLFNILTGASHFLVGLLLFVYFSSRPMGEERLAEFFRVATLWCLCSITFVILVLQLSQRLLGLDLYLGLACQVLIPLSCYALYKKNVYLLLFILALILFSGKRSVLLALIAAIIVMSLPLLTSLYRKFVVKGLVLATLSSLMVFSLFLDSLSAIVSKFEYDETKSLDYYSSGRLAELESAFNFWRSDEAVTVLGAGFGYTYTYVHESPGLSDVENYKNVHFSYAAPFLTFGLLLGFFYLLSFFALILTAIFKRHRRSSFILPLKISLLSYSFYACFSFILFNEPFLWAVLGIMNRKEIGAVKV